MTPSIRGVLAGVLLVLTGVTAPAQSVREVPLSQRWQELVTLTAETPSHTFTVVVGPSQLLTLDVRMWPAEIAVEILTPSGGPLDPALVRRISVGPDSGPPLAAPLFAEGDHMQAQVASPPIGTWRVRVTKPAALATADVSLGVYIAGGLSVGITASRDQYQLGQPVVLSLAAFRGSLPAVGLRAVANVYTPGNENVPRAVQLADDGQGADTQAGDGLYTGSLADIEAGHYLVEAIATSADETARTATRFDVVQALAALRGTKRDSGVDANGDGLFDEVVVDVDVDVSTASTYSVLAVLRAVTGSTEIPAATEISLPAGQESIRLRFAADEIRERIAGSGPWIVGDVRLLWQSATGRDVLIDFAMDLGPTSSYTLGQLQRPVTAFLEGGVEQAVDTNGNGLFDSLQATMRVETRTAGSYTWSATLRAPDGTPLDVSVGRGTLPVGMSDIGFTFDGKAIGSSGQDGPYVLLDAGIYGPPEAAALQSVPVGTRGYRASQFEGSQVTIARLIELVEALPIFGRGGVPAAGGLRESLLQKLNQSEKQATAGRNQPAIALLNAFLHQLTALGEERVRPEDVDQLNALTTRIISNLTAL